MSNTKEKSNLLDGIEIKSLSKEEIQKLLEEGRKTAEAIANPPPPGDYNIGFNTRGKKTAHVCVSCKEYVEANYTVKYPEPAIIGPGGRDHWVLTKYRCTGCKLVYDFS